MQVPGDGVLGDAHDGRGFGVALVFGVNEEDRVALLLGQGADFAPEVAVEDAPTGGACLRVTFPDGD